MALLSEVRQSSLDMVNDIFQIGLKYVKHRKVGAFFINLFKPHLDRIIKFDAPEKDLIDVMWLVKKKIDPVLAKLNQVEQVLEGRELNDPKMQAAVEQLLLKNNNFIPVEKKIDTAKAAEILARLRNG